MIESRDRISVESDTTLAGETSAVFQIKRANLTS
jgi:hypothetical protein